MPDERVVVRFSLRDAPKQRLWLLVQRPEPEVCMKPPGYDEDLVVTSDTDSVARWYMGRMSLGQAMKAAPDRDRGSAPPRAGVRHLGRPEPLRLR